MQPGGHGVHRFEFGLCKRKRSSTVQDEEGTGAVCEHQRVEGSGGGRERRMYGRRMLSTDLKGGLYLWDIPEDGEGDDREIVPVKQLLHNPADGPACTILCIRFLSEREDLFATGDEKGKLKGMSLHSLHHVLTSVSKSMGHCGRKSLKCTARSFWYCIANSLFQVCSLTDLVQMAQCVWRLERLVLAITGDCC